MKYGYIAKAILLKRGSVERVRAEDAKLVGDLANGRDEFTPKQAEKAQEALNDLAASLRKKWKVEN